MKTGRRADTEYETQGAATMNRQRNRAVALATALAGIFLLSTCQQFFTTSLAGALARDSYTIPADITVAEATALLDAAIAEGDATMAGALVPGLYAAAGDAVVGSAEYNDAANALVSAVVLSSGVGPAVAEMLPLLLPLVGESNNLSSEDESALISEALATASTISLNDAELEALFMIADNPPEGLSADDAYTTAFALVANAYVDAGINLENVTEFSLDAATAPAGVDPDSLQAAQDLIDHAQSLTAEGGTPSAFADYLAQLGL